MTTTLIAIAVSIGIELNHPDVIIFLAQQQAERELDEALKVAKRHIRDQRREWEKQRTRYLRAVRSRNQRGARLARQAMGRAKAQIAVGAEAHRRFDYYFPHYHGHY